VKLRLQTFSSRLREERGAALVEFAIVVPLFLLLALGAVDFGRAYNYWIDTTHLSHTGARWAAVNKNPGPEATLQESIRSYANTTELKQGGTEAVPNALSVCIAFPEGEEVGKPVEVTISSDYNFLNFLQANTSLTTKTITAKSTMRLEQIPTNYSAGCL
jgi:Flp pilus assembly protein TadG